MCLRLGYFTQDFEGIFCLVSTDFIELKLRKIQNLVKIVQKVIRINLMKTCFKG